MDGFFVVHRRPGSDLGSAIPRHDHQQSAASGSDGLKKRKTRRKRLASNLACLLKELQPCPANSVDTCICRTLPPEQYQMARSTLEAVHDRRKQCLV